MNTEDIQKEEETVASPTETTVKPFNPSELPDEVLRYIDQERTKASRTAQERAMRKLREDDEFKSKIREELEIEAKMSVEEKNAKEREEIAREREAVKLDKNKAYTMNKLAGLELSEAEITTFADFLTTSDEDSTHSRVEAFVTSFTKSIEEHKSNVTKEMLKGTTTPEVGAATQNEASLLEQKFAEAKAIKDNVGMAAVIREAAMKNIELNLTK